MKVNVLGMEYTIKTVHRKDDPILEECDGYCDDSIKTCVVAMLEPDKMSKADLDHYRNKVLRHEITHAFLFESGLHHLAHDETLVDCGTVSKDVGSF